MSSVQSKNLLFSTQRANAPAFFLSDKCINSEMTFWWLADPKKELITKDSIMKAISEYSWNANSSDKKRKFFYTGEHQALMKEFGPAFRYPDNLWEQSFGTSYFYADDYAKWLINKIENIYAKTPRFNDPYDGDDAVSPRNDSVDMREWKNFVDYNKTKTCE
ncbi:MAG: hypothetical protein V4691_03690 [Pseudomonadota bacterium]